MGRNVSEYLFLSLPYLRMCLRNQLGQKILPKFSAAKLSHVYRNLHYKQLPLFWKEQYWLLGNLSASLRTKASPKGQNNLSVSVLGQSETNCCCSGSQQPKAERTPHLHYSGQRERDLSSLNQSIFAIAAALPSARERISRCVWPLTIPGMPLALSYHLWTCTKSHTNSVTVFVSMTELLWRDCVHQFVLDAPFIQAKI